MDIFGNMGRHTPLLLVIIDPVVVDGWQHLGLVVMHGHDLIGLEYESASVLFRGAPIRAAGLLEAVWLAQSLLLVPYKLLLLMILEK